MGSDSFICIFIHTIPPNDSLITIKKIFKYKLTAKFSKQQLNRETKKRNPTITLLISSFLFMIYSIPEIILFCYFFDNLSSSFYYLLPGSDLLNFTFIGLNFLIYFILNKIFRSEFCFCIYQIKVWARFNCFNCCHLLRFISLLTLINEDFKYNKEIKRTFFTIYITKKNNTSQSRN